MDYTKEIDKSSLITVHSKETGLALSTLVHQEQIYKRKKSNYKGIRRMSIKMFEYLAGTTPTYSKVLVELVKNVNTSNELKIPLKNLAHKLDLKPSNVSTVISKLVKQKVVKKNGRTIILSPYLYIPYNTSDDKLFILQTWWDSNFTYDITPVL